VADQAGGSYGKDGAFIGCDDVLLEFVSFLLDVADIVEVVADIGISFTIPNSFAIPNSFSFAIPVTPVSPVIPDSPVIPVSFVGIVESEGGASLAASLIERGAAGTAKGMENKDASHVISSSHTSYTYLF
jgi:hypothetical protein